VAFENICYENGFDGFRTISLNCFNEALILSGLRGGGSGGSDAAIVGPLIPFNCIFTRKLLVKIRRHKPSGMTKAQKEFVRTIKKCILYNI
jgi:hypothetical protein